MSETEETRVVWRVRTTLADRPGALAALARRCGDRDVNILGLQIFPGVDGVTDELVLRTPEGWQLADVAELVEIAGGHQVAVSSCTVHALHDAPTRYLQAGRQLVDRPGDVAQILAEVLDADDETSDHALHALQDVIEVTAGPVRSEVRRVVPFTETERARAAAFVHLAATLLGRANGSTGEAATAAGAQPSTGDLEPVDGCAPGAAVRIRVAEATDLDAVIRMHDRCSAESTSHRFHAPLARLGRRLARRLVSPHGGAALVAVAGSQVVGLATLAPYEDVTFEVGILVEDSWQRRGIGSMLLHQAARMAKAHGADEVVCLAQSDNAAVLPTVLRSGLVARVRTTDDGLAVSASVRRLRPLEAEAPRVAATVGVLRSPDTDEVPTPA